MEDILQAGDLYLVPLLLFSQVPRDVILVENGNEYVIFFFSSFKSLFLAINGVTFY